MSEEINSQSIQAEETPSKKDILGKESRKIRRLSRELSRPARIRQVAGFMVDTVRRTDMFGDAISRDYEAVYKRPDVEGGKVIIEHGALRYPFNSMGPARGSLTNLDISVSTPIASKRILRKDFILHAVREFTDTSHSIRDIGVSLGFETDSGSIVTMIDRFGEIDQDAEGALSKQFGLLQLHGMTKFVEECFEDPAIAQKVQDTASADFPLLETLQAINKDTDLVAFNIKH